jgi:hypothetical protein
MNELAYFGTGRMEYDRRILIYFFKGEYNTIGACNRAGRCYSTALHVFASLLLLYGALALSVLSWALSYVWVNGYVMAVAVGKS